MSAAPQPAPQQQPAGWYDRGPKRAFDLAILCTAHILLLPVWLLLWLVISLTLLATQGRPLFYTQKRIGRNAKPFRAWKFRTMVRDADRVGPAWTDRDDPRVTAVGRALRRTALDELPQVLNIALGDMSFVGPRALARAEVEELERRGLAVARRTPVRPGLTGLAQLYSDRGDPDQKLSLDIRYIESMSPLLDLKIVLLSVWNSLTRKWDQA